MSEEVTISVERETLVYGDGWGQAHVITDPSWAPDRLDYVGRAVLAARLRAIAEYVDPGTLDEYHERIALRTGASVSRP